MASSTLVGSNFGSSTTVPPANTVAFSRPDSPSAWNSGITAMVTESLSIAKASVCSRAFMNSWKCVSLTPFGFPVVPEV